MEWLVHNAIADMDGPHFLLFYACAIGLTLAWCWWCAHGGDRTGGMAPPRVPSQPDPYELAYLRGGEGEVAQLAVFSLIERGYLWRRAAGPKAWIERTRDHPSPDLLSDLERHVFYWVSPSRSVSDVARGTLSAHLRPYCASYRLAHEREQLLIPESARSQARQANLVGGLVILGLGGYKLGVALSRGRHNIGFLVLMGVAGLVLLALVSRPPRLTRRGRAYLQQLQLAFGRLKAQVLAGAEGAADPNVLLLLGLFGAGALVGTPFAYYPQMLHPVLGGAGGYSGSSCGGATSGTSCSSSSCSGSSSCGGGGGGGGCGGCGTSGG